MLARFLPAPSKRNDDSHGGYLRSVLIADVKAQVSGKAKFRGMARDHMRQRLVPRAAYRHLATDGGTLRSNDPVYLSFVRHVLAEEGIDYLVLDEHMSALEGSIGILPRASWWRGRTWRVPAMLS